MATYDVFLSYSTADREVVEALAGKLRDDYGVKVFLDRWELIPGAPWQQALEKALAESQCCAVFIGPQGLGPWHSNEMRVALGQRVEQQPKRVIPVLLPGAEEDAIPQFLAQRMWVDLRSGPGDEAALHRLVAGIRGLAPGAEESRAPEADHQEGETGETGTQPKESKERSQGWPWFRGSWGLGLLAVTLVVVLSVFSWLRPQQPAPTPSPDLYSLRLQVLDATGRPVEGSKVKTSAGNEPHLLPDGWWQIEIPAVKVPANGQVTLWVEHPEWKEARRILQLGDDPNPQLEIRLEVPDEPLAGIVVNAEGRGVEGARVTARNFAASAAVTDQDGRFELSVEAARDQRVRLHIEHSDYVPKDSFCFAGSTGCSVVLQSP